MKVLKVLVVEDEEYLREYFEFLISQEVEADILTVGTARAAIAALQAGDVFDVVICDYNMPEGNGSLVLKYIVDAGLSAKFLLCSADGPEAYGDIDPAAVYGYVVKPDVYGPLIVILKKLQEELQRAKLVKNPVEQDFVRVPASVICSLVTGPVDIYQKLSPTNFIRIIENADLACNTEIREYIERGATHFFVERKYAAELMNNYKRLVGSEFNRRALSAEETIDYLQASSEVVKELADSLGWSVELMELTNKNVNMVVTQMRQRGDLAAQIKRFHSKEESYFGAHCALLAYVTIGLSQELRWDSFDLNYKLAFAAFLHDMTLTDNEVLNRRDYLSEIERGSHMVWLEGTLQHPQRAAELLKEWPQVPPGVETIVLQHHEKPNGGGFPMGLEANGIRPLSALFIVAEDLIDYSLDQQELGQAVDLEQFVASRASRYTDGYFIEVFEVLAQTLRTETKVVATS